MKSLKESLNGSSRMSIDDEMKLWEKRAKDQVGKTLKLINNILSDYEVPEINDFSVATTPSQMLMLEYQLDGDAKETTRKILFYAFSHDMANFMNGDITSPNVPGLDIQLKNLAKAAKFSESEIQKIQVAAI